MVKQYICQVCVHEIERNHAAITKRSAFHYQIVEFAKIQNTIFEMDFKNKPVTHRKINVQYLTIDKIHSSESNMIDSDATEITVGKSTIRKSNPDKITTGEIAAWKMAYLKFFQIESIFRVNLIGVILVVNIIGHKFLDELQSYFNFKCHKKL